MSPQGRRPTDDDYWDLFAEDEDPQRVSGVRRHLEAGSLRRAEVVDSGDAMSDGRDDDDVRDGDWDDDDRAASPWEHDEEPDEPELAPSARPRSTAGGALYRSVNAPREPGTEPALSRADVARLRSIQVDERPMVYVSDFDDHRREEEPVADEGRRSRRAARRDARDRLDSLEGLAVGRDRARAGLRPLTGYLLVIGLTVATAVAERLLEGDTWTSGLWLTGLALLVSSVYVACTVGPGDFLVAVFAPPLAALVVALTVGQFGAVSTGGFVTTHALAAFNTLGASALGGGASWNWAWILGTTLLASVIVVVRSLIGRR